MMIKLGDGFRFKSDLAFSYLRCWSIKFPDFSCTWFTHLKTKVGHPYFKELGRLNMNISTKLGK